MAGSEPQEILNAALRAAASRAAEIAGGGASLLFAFLPGEDRQLGLPRLRAAAGFSSLDDARGSAEALAGAVQQAMNAAQPSQAPAPAQMGARGQSGALMLPLTMAEHAHGLLVVGVPRQCSAGGPESIMERSHFLSGLAAPARKQLLARGRRVVFTDGTVIFHQDDPGDSMLVIETGRVEISSIGSNGRRILLGHLGSGDLVGELSLLDEETRSGDVTAAGPVTGIMLTFADVKATLTAHPEAMFSVLIDLSRKLRAANALAENRALDDGAARLARCLLELSKRWGVTEDEAIRLREKFPQATLGQMASLSRENVNRRLRAWTRDGWIETVDGRLILRRPELLREIAESGD